jgi:hypothetical protein
MMKKTWEVEKRPEASTESDLWAKSLRPRRRTRFFYTRGYVGFFFSPLPPVIVA